MSARTSKHAADWRSIYSVLSELPKIPCARETTHGVPWGHAITSLRDCAASTRWARSAGRPARPAPRPAPRGAAAPARASPGCWAPHPPPPSRPRS
eukprot:scaffold84371_cov51-Phaeocystis_antarctica.AAC.2